MLEGDFFALDVGQQVSSKMRKAFDRVKNGDSLQVVTEQDFLRLLALGDEGPEMV